MTFAEWGLEMKKWIDGIRQASAQLRYHLHIEPNDMTIEEWALRVKELEWIKTEEAKSGKKK